jgi:phage-related protein
MPSSGLRKIPVVFYRTQGGTEVVRDWLRSLDDADRQAVGLDLMRVQYRWPVGMPLCRSLGDGLWEVRTSLPSNRIARVLFSVRQGRILVLHGGSSRRRKRRRRTIWPLRAAETANLKNEGDQCGQEEESNPFDRETHHA